MVDNLGAMTKSLYVTSLSEDGDVVLQDPDMILALTFLTRLVNASHIVHALLIALLKTSYVDEENLEARIKTLSQSLDLGWEEELGCHVQAAKIPFPSGKKTL